MRLPALKPILILCNILTVFGLLVALFHLGQTKNNADELHARYWLYGIPAAVSQIGYGLDGYRGYAKIYEMIRSRSDELKSGRADAVIADLYRIQNIESGGVFFFPADEKGLQDFVSASFVIFGPKVSSLYYFYFLLLGGSAALHIVCFYNRPAFLAVPVLWLATLYAVVPALPLTAEVGSLLNPRGFGMLSVLATLSLLCLLAEGGPPKLWRLLLVCLQVLLIAFVVHMRNATLWQILILAGAALAVLVFTGLKGRSFNRNAATILTIVIVGFASSQVWVASRLAPEYFGKKLTHKLFWHNVLIGFSINDYFAKRHGLALNDTSILLHLAGSPEGIGRDDVFYSGTLSLDFVGKNPEIPTLSAMTYSGMVRDFAGYEDLARRAVWKMVKESPWQALRLFVFDKPRLFFRHAVNAVRPGKYGISDLKLEDQASVVMSDQDRRARQVYIHLPWFLGILVILLSAASFAIERNWARLLGLSAGAFIFSLLPVIATYPLIHLIWDSLALGLLTLLIALAGSVAVATRRWLPTRLVG